MSVVDTLKGAAQSVGAKIKAIFTPIAASSRPAAKLTRRHGRQRHWTRQSIVRVAKQRGLTIERDDEKDLTTIWRDFPGWKLAGIHVAADGSGTRADVEPMNLSRMRPGEVAYFLFDDRSGLE